MMFVVIHDVGEIRISLRRNRFRYSCNFRCIKYDCQIITKKGILETHVVVKKREKRVFTFFNGLLEWQREIFF